MLRLHVSRRLSDRLNGITHGPEGSIDKPPMTWVEQAVGHAALAIGGIDNVENDDTWLNTYLYSRAQSVMGGTSQIQRNLVAKYKDRACRPLEGSVDRGAHTTPAAAAATVATTSSFDTPGPSTAATPAAFRTGDVRRGDDAPDHHGRVESGRRQS